MYHDKNFYSGTSGLVLPGPKASFPAGYRDKSRLTYYATLFNSVEINSSFYKEPRLSTITRWLQEVPQGFRFTFKLPKTISHAKNLAFNGEDVQGFMEIISAANDHKGSILVQLPPALKNDRLDELQRLLAAIAGSNSSLWDIAVEFRHAGWYNDDTYRLLDRYHTCMVLHDLPASAAPIVTSKAGFAYFRFHGPGGRYRGSYTAEFLERYANHIAEQIRLGKTVYCYFNNTMGDALNNLQSLNRLVAAAIKKK